ncbi:hypothetical protein NC652_003137 [Populus alba x Populus x berolinensis]|nr:hypothetical protein NC652_003137 [Populus alba x Populus x berolinensis]
MCMPSARNSRERGGCFFKGKQLALQVQRLRGHCKVYRTIKERSGPERCGGLSLPMPGLSLQLDVLFLYLFREDGNCLLGQHCPCSWSINGSLDCLKLHQNVMKLVCLVVW